jgi:hypothetical protein
MTCTNPPQAKTRLVAALPLQVAFSGTKLLYQPESEQVVYILYIFPVKDIPPVCLALVPC